VAGTGASKAPGSAGSEVSKERERKDRQSFWESTFGKESRYQRPYTQGDGLDESQASPPSRGQSRNGKPSRSFLSGLRRKAKAGGAEATSPTVGSLEKDASGHSPGSWGHGGMI